MIIYLYGPDSYRRQRKLKELIAAYKNKYKEIDLLVIDLEDDADGWLKAKDFLNQFSIFVASKVLVVKESGAVDKKNKKEWQELLKFHLKTPRTFILISDNQKPNEDFAFLFKEAIKSQEFKELEGNKLKVFIQQELALRKLVFSPEAQRYFWNYINSISDRSWAIVNELEKISLAKLPSPVSLKDLQKYINWHPKTEVWRLTRELARSRNLKTSFGLLEKLFLQEEGARIFNSFVYQVREKKLERLAEYDVLIKSGSLEYEEALLSFILNV